MAIRYDVSVNWYTSPRIITVAAPSLEITIQDLVDTCRYLEEQFSNMSYPHLINAAGKEPLGGGIEVGITATLQNAILQFEGRTCLLTSGVATENDSNGVTLTAAGSPNGDFITAGVAFGDIVFNVTTGTMAAILEIVSEDTLISQPITGCSVGTWTIGDAYNIYENAVCEVSGGNLVAVDENGDEAVSIFTSPFVNVVRSSSSSATIVDLDELPDLTATAVWEKDATIVVDGSFGDIVRHSAYDGKVYVDSSSGFSGTTYPTGTLGQPVNNIADAVAIAATENIPNLMLLDDITLLATDNVNGYNLEGQNAARVTVTVTAGAKTNQTQWRNVKLTGTLDGAIIIRESILENITDFAGIAFNCLLNPGTIAIDTTPSQPVYFLSCYSGEPSTNPIIDLVNSGIHLIVRDFSGGLEIQNMSGSSIACLDFNSGQLVLDSTVTGGTIILRGVYGLIDNSTGTTITQVTNLDDIESKIDLVQLDVTDIVTITTTILKYHTNRTLIDENLFTLTVFDDDKVTPIAIFDLKDEAGTASITSIFERIPQGSP